MTVENTIELLKTFPPDHQVMFFDYASDLSPLYRDMIEQRTVVVDQSACEPRLYYSKIRLAQTDDDMLDHHTIQAVVIGANHVE